MVEEGPIVPVYQNISNRNSVLSSSLAGSETSQTDYLLYLFHSSMCDLFCYLLDWIVITFDGERYI